MKKEKEIILTRSGPTSIEAKSKITKINITSKRAFE